MCAGGAIKVNDLAKIWNISKAERQLYSRSVLRDVIHSHSNKLASTSVPSSPAVYRNGVALLLSFFSLAQLMLLACYL